MDEITVSDQQLTKLVIDKLVKVNIPEEHAEVVADVLVHANLRNVNSHGVMRMKQYIDRIISGGLNTDPKITVEKTGPVSAMVDGDNGMGHVVAKRAMETAINLAKENGAGLVGAMNSEHCGALSYFVELAAKEDLIGIGTTNANKLVAPFGGAEPFFGTNPIAYGFPSANNPPVILDMATSNVAFGKILHAREKGESIPNSWGINSEGQPTTDPNEVSVLLPIAGPKGYGLGLVVDVFSSILTGSPFGPHIRSTLDFENLRNLGHFFVAINPEMFIGIDQFKKQMDDMIESLHKQKPAKGFDRVLVPGEPEQTIHNKRLKEGIPIVKSTYEYLIS